jgi:hypothetical protein
MCPLLLTKFLSVIFGGHFNCYTKVKPFRPKGSSVESIPGVGPVAGRDTNSLALKETEVV